MVPALRKDQGDLYHTLQDAAGESITADETRAARDTAVSGPLQLRPHRGRRTGLMSGTALVAPRHILHELIRRWCFLFARSEPAGRRTF